MADPKDAIRHHAHQKDEKSRRQHDECVPEIVLGVNRFASRDAQIEYEKRHGNGEDTVAEGGEASHTFSSNMVVERMHQREFSVSRGAGKSCTAPKTRQERGRVRGVEKARYALRGTCSMVLLFACFLVIASVAAAQDEPNVPSAPQPANSPPAQSAPTNKPQDEKKDEGSNPAQAAAQKTKAITVQAAAATKNLGTAALVKARDWESGWLTGVYVEDGRPLEPVTPQQRREIYMEQTLATPGAYLKRMFAAGIDQARGAPPQWDDGWGGYAERFASREGQFITANTLAYLGNAKLKYEPRYDQCRCSGFWPRTRHAIMRNFLTYNQSEQELRPQWGLYGGAFGGGLVSSTWKPHPRNALADGGWAVLGQAGYGSLLNIFVEFSTDINRKIGAKRKRK